MIAFSSLLCGRRGYLHFIHHDELRVSLRKFLHLLEMTLGLYQKETEALVIQGWIAFYKQGCLHAAVLELWFEHSNI